MVKQRRIFIGFDPNEGAAYWVAKGSIERRLGSHIPIRALELNELRRKGLYTRPTEVRAGELWDVISQHTMSTEFAVSRFLVPTLAELGWALFVDCDVLVLADLVKLFEFAERPEHQKYAVLCVQHDHRPIMRRKMRDQTQSTYFRKNWTSVMMFNCDHPACKRLTLEVVNRERGLWLHQLNWTHDDSIGSLDESYNFLVGTSSHPSPKIIHFTEGGPWLNAYKNIPFAHEWFKELRELAITI